MTLYHLMDIGEANATTVVLEQVSAFEAKYTDASRTVLTLVLYLGGTTLTKTLYQEEYHRFCDRIANI